MKQGQTLFLRFGCEKPGVAFVPKVVHFSGKSRISEHVDVLNFFFLKVTNICQTTKINLVRKSFLNSSISLGPLWTFDEVTISHRIHVRHLLTYIELNFPTCINHQKSNCDREVVVLFVGTSNSRTNQPPMLVVVEPKRTVWKNQKVWNHFFLEPWKYIYIYTFYVWCFFVKQFCYTRYYFYV